MRTSNPMMKESLFPQSISGAETMTLQGAVNKTIALLALVVIGASYTWNLFYNQGPEAVQPLMIGGFIGAFIFAMITIFKAEWAPKTAPRPIMTAISVPRPVIMLYIVVDCEA